MRENKIQRQNCVSAETEYRKRCNGILGIADINDRIEKARQSPDENVLLNNIYKANKASRLSGEEIKKIKADLNALRQKASQLKTATSDLQAEEHRKECEVWRPICMRELHIKTRALMCKYFDGTYS